MIDVELINRLLKEKIQNFSNSVFEIMNDRDFSVLEFTKRTKPSLKISDNYFNIMNLMVK